MDNNPTRLIVAGACHPAFSLADNLGNIIDGIDAVVVSSPPLFHADIARQALYAGKHVLVEKPFTTSIRDAEELVGMAKKRELLLAVAHTFQYHWATRRLKAVIEEGRLGNILAIRSDRLALGRYQNSVDVVWDLAPHDIAIIGYLLGEMPYAVSAQGYSHVRTGHSDEAKLTMRFRKSDSVAAVYVSWMSPVKIRRVCVIGDRGMALCDYVSPTETLRLYRYSRFGFDKTEDGLDRIGPYSGDPLSEQDRHFVECIRTGRQSETPAIDGLATVQVLAGLDISNRSGHEVYLDEVSR